MVNVLGQHVAPLLEWLSGQEQEEADVTVKVHLYGKAEAKRQRKMGHVNLLAEDTGKALEWVRATGIWNVKE
ncbi:phosphoribosylaminoimidazole carboxylase ATPase subunit [compost metagenome]